MLISVNVIFANFAIFEGFERKFILTSTPHFTAKNVGTIAGTQPFCPMRAMCIMRLFSIHSANIFASYQHELWHSRGVRYPWSIPQRQWRMAELDKSRELWNRWKEFVRGTDIWDEVTISYLSLEAERTRAWSLAMARADRVSRMKHRRGKMALIA